MTKFTREDFERLANSALVASWSLASDSFSWLHNDADAGVYAALRIAARAMDREKIAREIARVRGGSNLWKTWLPVADAIIAMLTEDTDARS